MANERKTSLLEIYQNFLDEAELLESEIKENEFSIEETTDYLDQLYNKETDDFKVFSPRNVLNTQKREIENNKTKIEKLQEYRADYDFQCGRTTNCGPQKSGLYRG